MDGILVIRKEKGYTSHDVVAKLRGILHMKKIGHTGTLDPAAEGVLPVALGRGTRLVELLTEKEKTYEAVLRHPARSGFPDPSDSRFPQVREKSCVFWYHRCHHRLPCPAAYDYLSIFFPINET